MVCSSQSLLREYVGSMGAALRHYENVLRTADEADSTQTDARSNMEPKVLEWMEQTQFYQLHASDIRLMPQFQIGRYLRQLDPRYRHPAWICDFLLRYETPNDTIEIIIEYDGFDAHFKGHDAQDINAINYESYKERR